MNNLRLYFKNKWSVYSIGLGFIGIFYLILYLYGALIDAIEYAAILCLCIMLIYFIVDYYMFNKKVKQLYSILSLNDTSIVDLPSSQGDIEELYQQLYHQVNQLHHALEEEHEYKYHDMLDYFTLWVHQIKTPISALRLLIQTLEGNHNELLIQVLKIEQYVDMVLHYMKIDHMDSDIQLKRGPLAPVVNEVIKKQATFFIQKKIKLQLDPIDCDVLMDEKWIAFVIEQILSNAIKYTKEGSIHVYVKEETLYIEDTGIGISSEDLPRLFEKGFTGYNGRMDKKASGLGLYLCKQIVDNLGYSLTITSKRYQGTQVALNLHVDDLKVE